MEPRVTQRIAELQVHLPIPRRHNNNEADPATIGSYGWFGAPAVVLVGRGEIW